MLTGANRSKRRKIDHLKNRPRKKRASFSLRSIMVKYFLTYFYRIFWPPAQNYRSRKKKRVFKNLYFVLIANKPFFHTWVTRQRSGRRKRKTEKKCWEIRLSGQGQTWPQSGQKSAQNLTFFIPLCSQRKTAANKLAVKAFITVVKWFCHRKWLGTWPTIPTHNFRVIKNDLREKWSDFQLCKESETFQMRRRK